MYASSHNRRMFCLNGHRELLVDVLLWFNRPIALEIVRNCQSYLGFNLPSDLWPNRVKRFDVKYATSGGSFVKYGFTVA